MSDSVWWQRGIVYQIYPRCGLRSGKPAAARWFRRAAAWL
jgi:hypothetical protein